MSFVAHTVSSPAGQTITHFRACPAGGTSRDAGVWKRERTYVLLTGVVHQLDEVLAGNDATASLGS